MKKRYLILYLIFAFNFLSCDNYIVLNEQSFYKRYNNDSLIGYTIRNYTTQKDVLKERIIYFDTNYRIIDSTQRNRFLLKEEGLNILYKKRGKYDAFPYVLLKEKESITKYVNPLLGKIENTYKGKSDFNGYRNLYKIHVKHIDMKEFSMNIYLDNNFKLIGRDSISLLIPFDKELKVDKNEFSKGVPLDSLFKITKEMY